MTVNAPPLPRTVLWIDASNRSWQLQEIPVNVTQLLLGGKGIGAWLLLHHLPPNVAPCDPENVFLLLGGPLTGTRAPSSSRFAIVTKSPRTGTFLDSYCGGRLGFALRLSGLLGIGIIGRADSPLIVRFDGGNVSFEEASSLWGKSTYETEDLLEASTDETWQVLTIGPAGERRSPLAGVFSHGRCAGRGGAGAVLGSKNVKAILIKEEGSIPIARPEAFRTYCDKAYRDLRLSSEIRKLGREGTTKIMEALMRNGGIGTRNFQLDSPGEVPLLPQDWWDDVWERSNACFGCSIGCGKYFLVKERLVDGPDFETIFALGTNCGIADRKAIAQGNFLCDAYGIDTISTGGIVAFLMELTERGFLDRDEDAHLRATWGSSRDLLDLIERLGKGELHDVEGGVRDLSARFPGSEEFAMHVKGLEFPAYDPRKAPGIGLAYAVSDRGACHLRGAPIAELLGMTGSPSPAEEAEIVVAHQDELAALDCLIVCAFVNQGTTLDRLAQLVSSCTGFDIANARALEHVGRRAWNLSRLLNLREGVNASSDVLPRRCLNHHDSARFFDEMKQAYYALLGWNDNGEPSGATLKELSLDTLLPPQRAKNEGLQG